tara:strand:+ start:95 stop:1132 length:1038 start_codon:yes stop_codon:yes gene_type:complete
MSGFNSQKVGSLGEKSTLKSLTEVLKTFGFQYNGNVQEEIINPLKEEQGKVEMFDPNSGKTDVLFGILAGESLGKQLAIDLFQTLHSKGNSPGDYSFRFIDTSKQDVKSLKTDDIVIELKSKNETLKYPISLKIKSKSGNRIDGSASANNNSFLSRLFKDTPLIEMYPEVLDMVDDKLYREHLNVLRRKPGVTVDKASDMVNKMFDFQGGKHGDGSNSKCWKRLCSAKLKSAIDFLMSQPEYKSNEDVQKQLFKNVINLAGYKQDTHLGLALRLKAKPSVTTYYSSFNCKKYAKIVSNSFSKLTVYQKEGSTGMSFTLDRNFTVKLDYVPSGMKLTSDPFSTLVK